MSKNSLEDLEKKISETEEKIYPSSKIEKDFKKGTSFIVAEIIAGVSVGGAIGYYLDNYLHTKVLFLLIFIILGLISSLYSIYIKHK